MSISISRDGNLRKDCIHFTRRPFEKIHVIGQENLREFVEGYRENVGAATALKYVLEENL